MRLIALLLLAGCAIRPNDARNYEAQLIAQGVVDRTPDAPIRITEWHIEHNTIGTPIVVLILYNDSPQTIRAYTIAALLLDDFGGGACLGGRKGETFESQENAVGPHETFSGRWLLSVCDRATHYRFGIAQVVMTDGAVWKAPGL